MYKVMVYINILHVALVDMIPLGLHSFYIMYIIYIYNTKNRVCRETLKIGLNYKILSQAVYRRFYYVNRL